MQDDVGIVDDWYKKLQQALMEAQALKDEAYEESRKRRKAESDFYKAAHKVRRCYRFLQFHFYMMIYCLSSLFKHSHPDH